MEFLINLSFAQWLGFLSFALGFYFYQKDDRKLKILMVIFQLNNVLHFYLLGSNISAISTLYLSYELPQRLRPQTRLWPPFCNHQYCTWFMDSGRAT